MIVRAGEPVSGRPWAVPAELVGGGDPTRYVWPLAVGGVAYAAAWLWLRRRS